MHLLITQEVAFLCFSGSALSWPSPMRFYRNTGHLGSDENFEKHSICSWPGNCSPNLIINTALGGLGVSSNHGERTRCLRGIPKEINATRHVLTKAQASRRIILRIGTFFKCHNKKKNNLNTKNRSKHNPQIMWFCNSCTKLAICVFQVRPEPNL